MKIISVNAGLPQLVLGNDEPVSTGIFKEPVAGRVNLRTLNLDGDRQADLSVHGGPEKAVYVYPSEHYDFWKRELPEMDLPWGMFGENFTTTGPTRNANQYRRHISRRLSRSNGDPATHALLQARHSFRPQRHH